VVWAEPLADHPRADFKHDFFEADLRLLTAARSSRARMRAISASSAMSRAGKSPSSSAISSSRRRLPASTSRRPDAVATTLTSRPSAALRCFSARPSPSSAETMREIAGGETPSISASAPTVSGPANARTDKSDRRSGPRPVSLSARRARRKRWIDSEWSAFAARVRGASTSPLGSGGIDNVLNHVNR